jgi:cell division protein FtsW (lipid II flippase)
MSLAARSDARLLAMFALLSLIATGCGIAAMVLSGTPQMRWIPNVVAWIVGGGAAFAIARTAPSPRVWIGIALGALALVAATLVGPDQQGVHRWLAAGPLFVNIAALTLPAALVAMARLGAQHRLVPMIATLLAAILALQPDASQAFALALAGFAILVTDKRISALVTALCLFGIAALSLLRADPLQPVAEVEQIIQLAHASAPALAWAAVASLAAIPAMLFALRLDDVAARALALYIAVACAAPIFGWFPVPLVGAGMSFPLGLWLGIGLLAARRA